MDVIVSHVNADFDSLGGLVGGRRLYPGAAMVLPGGESGPVGRFLSLHRDALPVLRPPDVHPETITRVVVVDTAFRQRIGAAGAWLDLPDVEVHLYDHHLETPGDIRASVSRLEAWGSVSAILAFQLRERGDEPAPIEATAMLLGIYEDTGALSYGGTRPEDLEAAAWLMRCGADLDVVAEFTRETLNTQQRAALRDLLAVAETVEVGAAGVLIASLSGRSYIQDLAPIANRLLDMEGADAVAILAELEGNVHVIARSRSDSVNVGAALTELGGGGHARAASARVSDQPLDLVKTQVIQALRAHAPTGVSACEIMTRPVRSTAPTDAIGDARQLMVRYGHSGLVVIENGQLVGVVTRRDADKAHHHHLDHAPVRGFMTRDVHTVTADTSLYELERIMIAEGIGRLPVMRDGQVAGIVTRTDVLRALHGARYVASRPGPGDAPAAKLLRETLPANLQRLLERIGEVAVREDAQVYVVGGFVRDLFLGERNLDVDVLVEPDAIALARAVAADQGGELKAEPRFGTAKVALPGGFHIDFATARTESYARPGALPEVESSSITDDLRRRDFTINAMAIALRSEGFGRLLDPFRGNEDLERRRIRVLHNLSFRDDPTRIFRAVRFEERYHFRMDRHTESLARNAVETDALAAISPERIRESLRDIAAEGKPVGALLRLDDLGVLRWICDGLTLDLAFLQRIPGALDWWREHGKEPVSELVVYLAATLAPAGVGAALRAAEQRLRITAPDLRRIEAALNAITHANELLPLDAAADAISRALRPQTPEALVLLRAWSASTGDDRAKREAALERFVTHWRNVRLEITGDQLIRDGYRPGPRLGAALARTLDAKLNGELTDQAEELSYARALLGE